MKLILKTVLKYYLKYITKLVLFVHKPVIVAISGSTNKSFVKEEIKNVLEKKGFSVRSNPKNFNTEIGLPLAVLNLPSGYNSYKNWLPIIFESLFCIFKKDFPAYLVLELGVSRRGDMKYLLSVVNPKISVITDITQRYLESFSGMDDLAEEYKRLVEKTKKNGIVILNYDNSRIQNIAKTARRKTKTILFGESENVDWKISEIERSERGESFKVTRNNEDKKVEIKRYGKHHIYAKTVGMVVEENLKIV
jgi:UDP-N-acetylmuramyl pentapeptide synthase